MFSVESGNNNVQLVNPASMFNNDNNLTNNISSSSSFREKKISFDSSSINKKRSSNRLSSLNYSSINKNNVSAKLSSLDASHSEKRKYSGSQTEQQCSSISDVRKKHDKKTNYLR